MDRKVIDLKIHRLRAEETRIRARIQELLNERKRLETSQLRAYRVGPASVMMGGRDAEFGTLQNGIRSSLDQLYRVGGLSHIGAAA